MRNPLLSDLQLENIVDYCIEFMQIVNVPRLFTEEQACIPIEKHRGILPCDFYRDVQVKFHHHPLRYQTGTFTPDHSKLGHKYPDMTYKIQGRNIITSIEHGEVDLAYLALQVDDEGFPIIPENEKFLRALEDYIKLKHYSILFDIGRIKSNVLAHQEQEYAWSVGALESAMQDMSLGQAESFYNDWTQMVERTNEFNHGFRHQG